MTNLTKSWKLNELIVNRVTVYHPYTIREGDRPDIIAEKMYGDSRLDWIILLTNNIIKPLWEWPLMYSEFIAYVKGKYGSTSAAMEKVHHYEYISQAMTKFVKDDESHTHPEVNYEVDATTYATIPPKWRREVSAYAYEEQLNEDKRNIRILDPGFIPQVKLLAENVFD